MRFSKRICAAVLALLLVLTGCAVKETDPAALGWEEDWTAVGDVLASEPVDGFDPSENLDAMAPTGLWYATWITGPGETITNSDGKEGTVYDAQIYLLIQECKNTAAAGAALEEWETRERDSYTCGQESDGEYAGQSFTLLPMEESGETNPYDHGMAAFGVRGKLALCVELLCRESFEGDPAEIMEGFLSGLHYNDTKEE